METGIYGGTFNPVHLGHIHLLKAAAPCFDRILVMPDRVPPHKEAERLASGEDRAAMLRLAVSDIPKAEVCTLELEAEGRSYTYLTLRKLRALYPDDRFTLIIGGDMLRTFKEWRNWRKSSETLPSWPPPGTTGNMSGFCGRRRTSRAPGS